MADSDPRSGGVVEGVSRLTQELASLGHQQEWFTLDHPDDAWVDEAPVTVHAKGRRKRVANSTMARILNWSRYAPEAARWLSQNVADFDGVIVHGLWNYSTRCARLALVNANTPYVVFPHGMLDPWFREHYPMKHLAKRLLWAINEGVLLRNAEAAAFTTERERELARANWSPWRIRDRVVGFGATVPPPRSAAMDAAWHRAVPSVSGRPYLLFLSRLHEKKGVELLLDAFAEVSADMPLDLVIAGPGDEKYVQSMHRHAAGLPSAARIHFPGMIEGDAKWAALYGCSAMVLPSFQENFGVVVAEALGCGRPVIISEEVNIAPAVVDAGAGIVCQPERASLASALRRFQSLGSEQRTAMGEKGGRLFSRELTMPRTAASVAGILSKPD